MSPRLHNTNEVGEIWLICLYNVLSAFHYIWCEFPNKSSMVTSFCTMFQYSLCNTPYVVIIVRGREQRVEVILRNDPILLLSMST